jgi:fructokinase
MILSIGEILADMIGEKAESGMLFKSFCGGAPFNVAVNAKNAGAKVGFVGRVGNDPVGRFLIQEAKKANLDSLDIQIDDVRNTTLAFVTLTDGERDFAFYRHDTADFNTDIKGIEWDKYQNLNIVHLGSLMLSEKAGRKFAKSIAKKTKAMGKILSFDVNFRKDIYKDFADALKAYKPFVECADIVKFSDDEILDFTGKKDIESAVKSIIKPNKLILVTLGSKGSSYYYNDINGVVATEKVKPIDTTGAGDAFFGAFLANIEGKEINKENIELAMQKANKAGADATQFLGAIKL